METEMHFEVDLTWKSGRRGLISSPVLHSTVEVATPPEFPKGEPGIWSPEHLLVAAVNSCLMTTFLAVAENSSFPFIGFESKATGKLEKVEGTLMVSEIVLSPTLTIGDRADESKALRVLQKSEAACLISNSVKSRIVFHPEIKILQSSILSN